MVSRLRFQLNSIDLIFRDAPEVTQGLLHAYGRDNDVTYLISKVKLPKIGKEDRKLFAERDVTGHITWEVGNKKITIGWSLGTRILHTIKSFFSKDYRDACQIKVIKKIEQITKAYFIFDKSLENATVEINKIFTEYTQRLNNRKEVKTL